MADPLSISTGAAGLVSLAIGICQSLVTYYASWKDYNRDIAHLHRYLETVSENVAHLQSCLNRYDFPAALKQQAEAAILACDGEIKSLEAEANLVKGIGQTEIRRTRMKTFVRNAAYPFKESTLKKLENSLSHIQSTVDSAVFVLGLDSLGALTSTSASIATEITDTRRNIAQITDEIPLIRTTMKQFEQYLPAISANISLMASDVQDIKEGLYQMRGEKRVDEQRSTYELFDNVHSTPASSIMMEFEGHTSKKYQFKPVGHEPVESIDKIGFLGQQLNRLHSQCISTPSLLQAKLDNVKNEVCKYQDSSLERAKCLSWSSLSMNGCSCRSVVAYTTLWPVSRSFQISTDIIRSHRKGCPLSKTTRDQASTLRLKTVLGARILMKALELSLSLTHGAGGYAISSSIKMRTLFRGDSPVFQLFNTKPLDLVLCKRLEWHDILDYITESLAKIEGLFREGKASPNDINVDAKTILQLANDWIDNMPSYLRDWQLQATREKLLLGLAQLGVPLNHRDFANEDIFTTILKKERCFQSYSPQWHVYSSLCAFEPVPQPGSWFKSEDLFVVARELEEYADFYDCGILSTAILAKNQQVVERILLERPQSIHERNKVGQTPMHLATDWPWGLTRLISAKAPCDIRDRNGFYPLDYALELRAGPGVLDSKAGEVYDAILSKGEQVPSALEVPSSGSSVYHTPWLTTVERTKLYNSGFQDIDSLEQTPLMITASEVALRGTMVYPEWLISKGANPLKELTAFGVVQLHYIASAMAPYFLRNLRPLDAGEQWLSRESISNLRYGFRFLIRKGGRCLKDRCHCGCSMNGCSPLHLFLKCTMRYIHSGTSCSCQAFQTEMRVSPEECEQGLNRAFYYFVDCLLDIFYEGETIPDLAYHEIIRLFVFEVLGLTHTCCRSYISSRVIIQPKTPEEVEEIQDEEREILRELDRLCKEGSVRRAYYGGPFHEFLADFLSEIRDRPQVGLDEEDIRKIEEIGVVLQNDINE